MVQADLSWASLSTTLLTDHPDPNPWDPYSHGSLVMGKSLKVTQTCGGSLTELWEAEFTSTQNPRHQALWACGLCCPFISIQGCMCTLGIPSAPTAACTATDQQPLLITLHSLHHCLLPLHHHLLVLSFHFCAITFPAYHLLILTWILHVL